MSDFVYPKKSRWMKKITSSFVALTFSTSLIFGPATGANAQYISNLPKPGEMVLLSPAFQPPVLKGMTLHPENPLQFDFIVDRGQDKLSGDALKGETQKLLKYFLAAMTIPDNDSWVNLSPYEGDRIIPDMLGSTDMGKQMLEQDYLLKQLSASLTNPQEEIGKKFWDTVYKKVFEKFGTTSIPINTFNKVWIVPDRALILEEDGYVFIGESHLKVMLDQDYTSLKENLKSEKLSGKNVSQDKAEALSSVSSDVVRQIILPELEKEINEGKNFAAVRQIYHSVILATWYKQNLKNSLLGKIYVDKSKIAGVNIGEKDLKQKVYEQYLAAFRKGVYNLIKEDYDLASKETLPRKYFSGGLAWKEVKVTRAQGVAANSIVADMRSKLRNDPGRYIVSYARMTEGTEAPVVTQVASAGVAKVASSASNIEAQSKRIYGNLANPIKFQRELTRELKQRGLFRPLLNALRDDDEIAAKAIIREYNNREALEGDFYQGWQPSKAWNLEGLSREGDYYQRMREAELKGENVTIMIAGGLSSRFDPLRAVMTKLGIQPSKGVWDMNLRRMVVTANQRLLLESDFRVIGKDGVVDKKVSADAWATYQMLRGIDASRFDVSFSVGDYLMWAKIKGAEIEFSKPAERNRAVQNKKVVILINKSLLPFVRASFIKHNAYGFDYKNIIFSTGAGFHPTYGLSEKRQGLVPTDFVTAFNHGASLQEILLGAHGFYINPETGEEISTEESILQELMARGAVRYLVHRVNDGMLMLPKGGGFDLDFLIGLDALHDRYGFDLVMEGMENPGGVKGGLSMAGRFGDGSAEYWEGNESDEPGPSGKVGQLLDSSNKPLYSRLYMAGYLRSSREALIRNGGLKTILKISRHPKTGKLLVAGETPSGQLSRILKTATVTRGDLFTQAGVVEGSPRPAVNRDFKDASTLGANLRLVLQSVHKNYNPGLDLTKASIRGLATIDEFLWYEVFHNRKMSVNVGDIAAETGLSIPQVEKTLMKLGFRRLGSQEKLLVYEVPVGYIRTLERFTPSIYLSNGVNGRSANNVNFSASSSVGQAVASSAGVANAAAQPAAGVGRAKVLVVDDKVPSASLSKQLTAAGYSVVVEPDIQKAATLAENNFDLIVGGKAQAIEPVIRKLISDGNKAKFVIFASAEALLDAGVQDLKDNHGVILQAKRNSTDAGVLVGEIQKKVPANEQKLAVNQPTVLRLGDLTTGSDIDFIVRLGNGEEITVMVEKKRIDGNAAFDITPVFGEQPIGNRSFILKAGRFEKNDNQPEEFAGLIRLGVDGLNVVITSLNGPATIVYSSGQTNATQAQVGASVAASPVGGIDFDPSLLNLQIKRNGRGVPLPLPQQNIENINIDGLYPVIINMQPATIENFPFLISAENKEKVPELSMR